MILMIFTHAPATLAAYTLAGKRIARAHLLVLGFASMAPDIDHFLPASLHATRTYLHNLPSFLAVLAMVCLLQRRFLLHAAAGYGSHILIDLADTVGIPLLFPLNCTEFALGLWRSPDTSLRMSRGLALDLALSVLSAAVILIVAFRKRRKRLAPPTAASS